MVHPAIEASRAAALERGEAALLRLAKAPGNLDDPLIVVALERLWATGSPKDPSRLLDRYDQRTPHYGRDRVRSLPQLSARAALLPACLAGDT